MELQHRKITLEYFELENRYVFLSLHLNALEKVELNEKQSRCQLTSPKYVKPCWSATRLATVCPPGIWTAHVGVKCLSLKWSSSTIIWWDWYWLGCVCAFWSLNDTEFSANTSSSSFGGGRISSSPDICLSSIVKLLAARFGSLNTKLTFWFITSQTNNRHTVLCKCVPIVAAIGDRPLLSFGSFVGVSLLIRFRCGFGDFLCDVMTSRCCSLFCCEHNWDHRTTSLVILFVEKKKQTIFFVINLISFWFDVDSNVVILASTRCRMYLLKSTRYVCALIVLFCLFVCSFECLRFFSVFIQSFCVMILQDKNIFCHELV